MPPRAEYATYMKRVGPNWVPNLFLLNKKYLSDLVRNVLFASGLNALLITICIK